MGDGDESGKITRTAGLEDLRLNISSNRLSRDLLQTFMGSAGEGKTAREEDKEIELNLGLSLGGRFGVDKSPDKLTRSSSIASFFPAVRDDNDAVAPTAAAHTGLVRTSSLPLETEEEWRKRKELQTLRRMEAKRRRSEKQRNLKTDKEGGGTGGSGSLILGERKQIELSLRDRLEKEKYLAAVKRLGSSVTWAAADATQASIQGGIDAKGKGSYTGAGKKQGFGILASQGSVESKGGSSSGVLDLEIKTLQGSSGEPSPTSVRSFQEGSNPDIGSFGTKARENISRTTGSAMESPSKRPDASRAQGGETAANSMEDMPSVFTVGDAPNGRRVDGILYKYGRGEEVRIMCICHGSFHSPAEFVKHAGGTDIDHPLRHIVVSSNAASLL